MLSILAISMMVLTMSHGQASNSSNCDVNEQQVDCAPEETCQPSCSAIFGKPCPRMCSERSCMCKSGFIRDDNLTCVPFSECKNGSTRAISIDCGENEVNTSCAPIQKCQPSCEKPHGKRCPRMCSLTPCICKEGYIRASATNLTCVEVNQCADLDLTPRSTCGRREEPDSCANPCQPTCREPNRSPCPTFTCSAGCVCKRGFRRADDTANSSCVKCS